MKIYKLTWSNEDDYGPTEEASFIVQAETEEIAKSIAETVWLQSHREAGCECDSLSKKFGIFRIEDITGKSVLQFSIWKCA